MNIDNILTEEKLKQYRLIIKEAPTGEQLNNEHTKLLNSIERVYYTIQKESLQQIIKPYFLISELDELEQKTSNGLSLEMISILKKLFKEYYKIFNNGDEFIGLFTPTSPIQTNKTTEEAYAPVSGIWINIKSAQEVKIKKNEQFPEKGSWKLIRFSEPYF